MPKSSMVPIVSLVLVVAGALVFYYGDFNSTKNGESTSYVENLVDDNQQGKDAVRKVDLETVKTALESYFIANSSYPTAPNYAGLTQYLTPGYIRNLPQDPKSSQSYRYEVGSGGTNYILSADLESSGEEWTVQSSY